MTTETEKSKLFVLLYDMPSQQSAMRQYCFGSCGKIMIGTISIPLDGYTLTAMVCRETQCPALAREMQEPCGTLQETEEDLYIRKLQEA